MHDFLKDLGIGRTNSGACGSKWIKEPGGKLLESISPVDGSVIATVRQASESDYDHVVNDAQEAFRRWRVTPAPKRGEMVREVGDALRKHKEALGKLVSLEMGKIAAEGQGEVQEMIDMCDFSVGLSRQLYGLSMHSERAQHRMYEQWHPLGPVGVITAFCGAPFFIYLLRTRHGKTL
jgi:aldehyde dehydrogenase (NAD+)